MSTYDNYADQLTQAGYTVCNGIITSISLDIDKHSTTKVSLILNIGIKSSIRDINFMPIVLMTILSDDECHDDTLRFQKGIKALMRIMEVIGVDKFEDIKGKYVRLAFVKYDDSTAKIIGNIIEDKWFDAELFFSNSSNKNNNSNPITVTSE